MFNDKDEQIAYIKENYPEVTDRRVDDNHWDIYCTRCKIVRGFQVVRRGFATKGTAYQGPIIEYSLPQSITFHCPVCHSYKIWLLFVFTEDETDEDGKLYGVQKRYKITSIPGEGLEEIEELPNKPEFLRKAYRQAYRQAIRSMDANAHTVAAAMFRRALQVITRDILKVKPGNLADELKLIVGGKYAGVTLTNDFSKWSTNDA